jgi:outer membrane protein assembly factor BamB
MAVGHSIRLRVLLVAMVLLLAGCDWPTFGFNAAHTGYNPAETKLGVGNVAGLHELWTDVTPDAIVSAPAVAGGVAYVGTRDNKLYAFSANGTTGCSGTPTTCAPLWSTPDLGGDIVSTPAVANGIVYIGSIGGKLAAFDAAGTKNCSGSPTVCTPLWSRPLSGDIIGSPTVANGVVYVVAANGFSDVIVAANATNGNLRWGAIIDTDLASNEHSASAVTVANGIAYAGFNASDADLAMVAAFDANGVNGCSGVPNTCAPLWTAPLDNPLFERTPVFQTGSLFASNDFGLNVYDPAGATNCSGSPKTCLPLWSASAPLATPAVAKGIVFVGNDAFDASGSSGCSGTPKTCMPLWTNANGVVGGLANGVAYSTTASGVTAYDATGSTSCSGSPKTCASLWSASISNPTSPVVVNGNVWIGSSDHSLHVFGLS